MTRKQTLGRKSRSPELELEALAAEDPNGGLELNCSSRRNRIASWWRSGRSNLDCRRRVSRRGNNVRSPAPLGVARCAPALEQRVEFHAFYTKSNRRDLDRNR